MRSCTQATFLGPVKEKQLHRFTDGPSICNSGHQVLFYSHHLLHIECLPLKHSLPTDTNESVNLRELKLLIMGQQWHYRMTSQNWWKSYSETGLRLPIAKVNEGAEEISVCVWIKKYGWNHPDMAKAVRGKELSEETYVQFWETISKHKFDRKWPWMLQWTVESTCKFWSKTFMWLKMAKDFTLQSQLIQTCSQFYKKWGKLKFWSSQTNVLN